MKWYEQLFSNYAEKYDTEIFTQGTKEEVDFLENEIRSISGSTILDIGCGTGRHAVMLAERGFNVKGIDLSENMLSKARKKAALKNVTVDFEQADARNWQSYDRFDMVIMLCEAGFSLMETDEMNFQILKNAAHHVKSGGKLIFTCLNALYPLFHSVKELMDQGHVEYKAGNFNLMTFRDECENSVVDDTGKTLHFKSNERFYAPSEIFWLLQSIGMQNTEIFGDPTGQYSRERPLTTDSFEMLVISEKP